MFQVPNNPHDSEVNTLTGSPRLSRIFFMACAAAAFVFITGGYWQGTPQIGNTALAVEMGSDAVAVYGMSSTFDVEWVMWISAFVFAYIGMFVLLILVGVSVRYVFKIAAKRRKKRLENSGNAPSAESWHKGRWIRFLLVLLIMLTALTVCITAVGDILLEYLRTVFIDGIPARPSITIEYYQ